MKKEILRKGKNGFLIKVGAVGVAASLLASAAKVNLPFGERYKIVAVSENVRDSIYKDNNYLEYMKKNAPDYEKIKGLNDLFLTDKTLGEIMSLDIDMLYNDDLSFLVYCDKLQQLVIRNAQILEDKDILYLAQFKNVSFYFVFDGVELSKMGNKKLNVEPLGKGLCKVLFNRREDNNSELMNAMLYSFLRGYEGVEGYAKIQDFLDDCLAKIDLEKVSREKDLLRQLVRIVTDIIYYDPDVSHYLKSYNGEEFDKKIEELGIKYTNEALSSLVRDDYPVAGVCANYVSLLTALCFECGLEAYYVSGTSKDVNLGHAWVLVRVDGEYKYVDVTNLDDNVFYNFLDNTTFDEDNALLYGIMMQDVDSLAYQEYELDVDVRELMSERKTWEDIVMYNKDLDGDIIYDKTTNMSFPLLFAVSSSSTGYGLVRRRRRR